MNISKKITVNPSFIVETFGNEILLFSVSTTKGIYLNETAYLIWKMCKKGTYLSKIIAILEEIYPETKETISSDVLAVVESLVKSNALIQN